MNIERPPLLEDYLIVGVLKVGELGREIVPILIVLAI